MKRFGLASLLLTLLAASALGADWDPWSSAPPRPPEPPPGIHPLQTGVRFFQRYISPVDGPRCPMYPTCSAYAAEALHKHGPLLGTLLTVDRLLHEAGPGYRTRPVKVGGRIRFFDPVAENDFWLDEEKPGQP